MEAQITISPAIAAGSFNFAVFLDFIARFTDALAWPAAVVIIAFWLRHPVVRLMNDLKLKTIRGAGIEAEFENALEESAQKTAEITPSAEDIREVEAKPFAKVTDNRGRVIGKFAAVGKALEQLAKALKPGLEGGAGRLQQVGRDLLEPAQSEIYNNLRELRNRAAHVVEFNISDEQIQQYEHIAEKLIASINALAAGDY